MKVLFSGFRDPYHSKNGGYDKIVNIDLPKKILLAENYFLGRKYFRSHVMRLPFTLLDLHTRIERYEFDITHLFYGEITMLFFLPYLKSKKHKTVITLHLNIEQRRNPKLFAWILKFFDGIIVLSTQQQKFLKERYGLESVFIPHGFSFPEFNKTDVSDSKGKTLNHRKINLLTIGSNYRDFKTLDFVINYFIENPDIHFNLVGVPKEIKAKYNDYKNVSIYNRLSDDEYYSIISDADYLLLPLTFATANNTLLEAQFLNLPSILPNIDGVLDYAAPAPLNYFYDDNDSLITIISNLKKIKKENFLSNFANRNFNWENIGNVIKKYYYQITNPVRS